MNAAFRDSNVYVSPVGGKEAASKRLAEKGWGPMAFSVGGLAVTGFAKGGAIVAFNPTDDSASAPLEWGGFAAIGPAPDPLWGEGMDALCDSAPGGSMDFSATGGKGGKNRK